MSPWLVDLTNDRNITYVPGFFKIFDEILVNAADNKVSQGPPISADGVLDK